MKIKTKWTILSTIIATGIIGSIASTTTLVANNQQQIINQQSSNTKSLDTFSLDTLSSDASLLATTYDNYGRVACTVSERQFNSSNERQLLEKLPMSDYYEASRLLQNSPSEDKVRQLKFTKTFTKWFLANKPFWLTHLTDEYQRPLPSNVINSISDILPSRLDYTPLLRDDISLRVYCAAYDNYNNKVINSMEITISVIHLEPFPKLHDIDATSPINKFTPESFHNGLENEKGELTSLGLKLRKWIYDNRHSILTEYNQIDTITEQDITLVDARVDGPTTMIVSMMVPYQQPGGFFSGEFKINKLKPDGSLTETTVIPTKVVPNTPTWEAAFGDQISIWAADFYQQQLPNVAETYRWKSFELLRNYINKNINQFFKNPLNTKITSWSPYLTSEFFVGIITYTGVDETGNWNQKIVKNYEPGHLPREESIWISPYLTPGSDDPLFNDYSNFINQKVNQAKALTNENLKIFTAEYLNQPKIKNNLPQASYPNFGQDATPSFITVEFDTKTLRPDLPTATIAKDLIHNNALSVQEAAPYVHGASRIYLPQLNLNLTYLTSTKDVNASGELLNYTASEVSQLLSNQSSGFWNNTLKNWINSNKQKIFTNYEGNLLNDMSFVSAKSENNNLTITVSLNNANLVAGKGTYNYSFKILNFKNSQGLNTTLKQHQIDAQEWIASGLWNQVFGSNDKGFAIDWNNSVLSTKAQQLKDYINRNINAFFENPCSLTTVSNISITKNTNSTEATASVTFTGYTNGEVQTNKSGVIKIILKPTPTASSPLFSDYEQFINQRVNQRKQLDNNVLQELTAEYLNTKLADLPNSCIPSSGSFNKNDISSNFNFNAISPTSRIVNIPVNTITTKNVTNSLNLPKLDLILNYITYLISIPASDGLEAYSAYDVINLLNNTTDALDFYEEVIVPFLIKTQPEWCMNYDSVLTNGKIVYIDAEQVGNDVEITLILEGANLVTGKGDGEYTLTITGFKDISSLSTKLKVTSIDAQQWINEGKWNQLFSNDKGFGADWTSQTIPTKNQELVKYMNQNIDFFFKDPANTTSVSSASITVNSDTSASAKIVFSGYQNQQLVNNITGKIDFILKPTPSANSPIFDTFQQYMQDKVNQNNGMLPANDNELKQWVSDYLNQDQIKNNLPTVIYPINKDKIVLPNFDKENSPVKIDGITTSTNPVLTLPNISLQTKNTVAVQSINVTSPINEYNATELDDIFNANHNDPKILEIKKWINKNKAKIFNEYPTSAKVTKIVNLLQKGNDTITVEVSLSEAYTPVGVQNNKNFSFDLTGFATSTGTTEFIYTPITAGDTKFKEIFGEDKGFAIDWQNPTIKQARKEQLNTFLTNPENYSKIFSGPIVDNPNVRIESFNVNDTQANVQIKYSGYQNGEFNPNISANMVINLKPTPSTDGTDTNPDTNPLVNYQNAIQNWIDQNHRFPNDNELKTIIANYLNSIKEKLPNAWIPNDGKGNFSANNISVDASKINKNNPQDITIAIGAINIISPTNVKLPASTVHVDITKQILNEISVDGSIADYIVMDIINDVSKQQKVNEWIQTKASQIFSPVDAAKVRVIDASYQADPNNGSDLNVTFKLQNAYGIDGLIELPATLKITGFNTNTSSIATKLKVTEMSWDDAGTNGDLFNLVFGSSDKGFTIDWQDQIAEKETKLKEGMNKHINDFFKNPNQTTVSDVKISIDSTSNIATATITYSGLGNEGVIVNNLKGTMSIHLRPTPSKPDISDPNNPFNDYEKYLQQKVDSNSGLMPNDETLKQWISDYLNQPNVKNNLPNACIPNNGSGNFSPSDINVSVNNTANPVTIIASTNGSNFNPLELPTANVSVKVTSVKTSIVATDPINQYNPSYILSQWSQNHNASEFEVIKNWMNNNLNKIFDNLPPADVQVTEITNVTKANTNDALSFTVTLSNAYQANGLQQNVSFTFTIKGFNSKINETKLNQQPIKYSDPIFKKIFPNDKGFAADWINDHTKQEKQLFDYMNTHISEFFISIPEPNHLEGVKVKSVNLDNINEETGICYVAIVYSGFDSQGWNEAIKGTLEIHLRGQLSINDTLSQVKEDIQNWIDQNKCLPNNEQLKQIISDFLNKNKDNLPNANIPNNGSGNFSPSDININKDPSKDETTGEVTYEQGSISTNIPANNGLVFPNITVNVPITKFKNNILQPSGDITSFTPQEIVEIVNNKINDNNEYDKILKFIQDNATGTNGFLENYNGNPSQNISITNASINPEGNIAIGVTVKDANTLNGKDVITGTVIISKDGLKKPDASMSNNLRINNIAWNDKLFRDIFIGDKGFVEDWSNPSLKPTLQEKANILKDFINKNADKFFTNVNAILKPVATSVEIIRSSDTSTRFENVEKAYTATIIYTGYENGIIKEGLKGTITITLRRMPLGPSNPSIDTSTSASIDSSNIYDQIQAAIAETLNNNNGNLPTSEELAKIIANVIQNNRANVADSWLPGLGNPVDIVEPNDIVIDINKILTTKKENGDIVVSINKGAIGIVVEQPSNIKELNSLGDITYIAPPKPKEESKQWLVWLIVASLLTIVIIFIILLVLYIYKRKKYDKDITADF